MRSIKTRARPASVVDCDSPTPLTLHKCGMLCLLQIAEILNLAHVVLSHEKFLCDLRNPIATCSFHSPWLWYCSPQTTRLLFGEYSPNLFIGRIISAPTHQRVILSQRRRISSTICRTIHGTMPTSARMSFQALSHTVLINIICQKQKALDFQRLYSVCFTPVPPVPAVHTVPH